MTRLGRELACIRCDAIWDVIEPLGPHIDPNLYVCPNCLKPVQQLELAPERVDRSEYNPATARIPF